MRPTHLLAVAGLASAQAASSSSTACWPSATPNSSYSMSTVSFTDVIITTLPAATPASSSYNSSTSTSTAAAYSTVSTGAATPVEGFSRDSSVLGLVVFFALSLCLL